MAVQFFYKFTSACVSLAILQVWNQRIDSRTTDCSPLITNIFKFPKQVRPGPPGRAADFSFSGTGQLVIQSSNCNVVI
jgi:hypothetical protein